MGSRIAPVLRWAPEPFETLCFVATSGGAASGYEPRRQFSGRLVRLGFRKPAFSTCCDVVLAAITSLSEKSRSQVFTVREVFDEITRSGTTYAKGTVFKTMRGMKEPPTRPPYTRLGRVDRQGFRLLEPLGPA
jgi:hypothetical protein